MISYFDIVQSAVSRTIIACCCCIVQASQNGTPRENCHGGAIDCFLSVCDKRVHKHIYRRSTPQLGSTPQSRAGNHGYSGAINCSVSNCALAADKRVSAFVDVGRQCLDSTALACAASHGYRGAI